MRFILGVIISGLLTMPASAQWFARGEFENWTNPPSPTYELVEQDDNFYTGTVTGLFAETDFEYKIATADWSQSAPNNNGKVSTDAAGEIHFNFWDITSWDDGWSPNDRRRVGYVDHQLFDWEIMGTFNNYASPLLLTDQGNGLHTGSFTFDAGFYEFKFRKQGDWSTTMGNGDFSNSGSNNTFNVLATGDEWNFELDLPNGRWRAYTEVAPPPDPDHNGDGNVDAADYAAWRKNPAAYGGDPEGYDAWRQHYAESSGPQVWYARGAWDSFGLNNPLTDQGGGHQTATITGLTVGQDYEYKIANEAFSESYPGSNGKVRADANGEINFHFYELQDETWTDGWLPNDQNRVGYEDSEQYDWEIVGGFNAWPNTNDPNFALTDQGNGLHTGSFTFATAGTYEFKFRHITADQINDPAWNTSIGDNFGNAAGNNSFTVTNPGENWSFALDLPNGRFQYFLVTEGAGGGVPEPSSLLLMVLAGLTICGYSRRK